MSTAEQSTTAPVEAPPHEHRPGRLYQAAAWVGIVAGILFIVGAVFFAGFALGRHSGYGGWWVHHGRIDRMGPPMMPMMDPDGDRNGMMGPGMMGPGMMGPGMMGPGMMGPGMMGPGMMGPGSTATATSVPPPPPRS